MRKEELKSLLSSFCEEDYYKNIDLHVHSDESDGKMNPRNIVEQAKRKGLKYVSICDHNNIDAYLNTNILSEDMVITGVEFDCLYKGVLIHILGYGIDVDNEEIKSLFANSKLGRSSNICRIMALRNPQQVIEKIKKAGGVAVLAHPCCYWTFNLDGFIGDLARMGIEGVEVYYPYNGKRSIVKFHSRKKITDIADKYGLIKTGGTDSHGKNLL